MSEFLAMGGYAKFVWSSFALAAVVLIANVLIPRASLRRIKREIHMDLLADDEARRASENTDDA